jgi:N-acetyl-anhydromuramyl-L-alanine amidase AmpD
MILDLSSHHPNPPPPTIRTREDGTKIVANKVRIVHGKAATRTPTGITLHQTWCWFGAKSPDARHSRALGVHAHWTCFRDGVAVQAYPLEWWVHHGNGWNGTDVGIEVEGKYEGKIGNPIDAPDGFDVALPIQAAREAVQETLQRHPTVRYIHAHRQSSGDRGNDPGRLLWREVALWAVANLGLVAEPDRVIGTGKALPADWR